MKMNEKAFHAVRAAKGRWTWGVFAARRYCEKRGVPHGLYRLACQLDIMAIVEGTTSNNN